MLALRTIKGEKALRGSKAGVEGIDGAYCKKYQQFDRWKEGNKTIRISELRALVPYELSMAVCIACENDLEVLVEK